MAISISDWKICFDCDSDQKDVHAVLIDLDLVSCLDDTTHSCQQDWKQFGVMAAFILEEGQVTNHNPNFQFHVYSGRNRLFFMSLSKMVSPPSLPSFDMLCVL